jgi:trehalose 6-phosphate phosphatase
VSDWSTPPDALSRRAEVDDRLEGAEGLVLGLDFDGTLAPIVDDHTEAALDPAVRGPLDRLAERPGVAVALVSGRALSDLAGRVGLDGAVYAGNHGLELGHDDEVTVHPAAVGLRREVDRLCAELDAALADVPGYAVENKGVTATVHFRAAPEGSVPRVVETVERLAGGVDGLRVTEGKAIRELRPAVEWDKGRVMELLAGTVPGGWLTVYLGDDTTDEDAFRAIQPEGIGVRVGSTTDDPVDTDAAYRLDDRTAVPRFLEWLDAKAPRRDTAGAPGWPGDDPLSHPDLGGSTGS